MTGSSRGPVAIGGMPGSGTRVFASILRLSGSYIGTSPSRALDARHFFPFAERWVDAYVESWATGEPLAQRADMESDFDYFVLRHLESREDPTGAWGWKSPRSICFLPFLHQRLSGLRYVHVMRDGRDIAFKWPPPLKRRPGAVPPLRSMGQTTLVDAAMLGRPLPAMLMALWARVNELAADYGEDRHDDYLRVRLEDLCEHPREGSAALLRFVLGDEPSDDLLEAAVAEVERPASLGRWREAEEAHLAEVTATGASALERFGYTD